MNRRDAISFFFKAFLALAFISHTGLPPRAYGVYPVQTQANSKSIALEIPQGWTVFRSQNGLIVPHPLGWNVQERGDGGFVVYRPGPGGGAIAVVYVQPIAKIEGRAAAVLTEYRYPSAGQPSCSTNCMPFGAISSSG